MTETIEVLKAARELISDPTHWIQGDYARDANNEWCSPTDENAYCFCSIGALAKALNVEEPGLAESAPAAKLLEHETRIISDCGIIGFNDDASHEEVLAVFDAAIARLA